MSVSEGQSLRGRRIPDQASLPAPSYRSQPPSYHTGLDQATNVPDELSIRSEPVEVPTRRPKVFLYYKVFRPDGVIPCKEPVNPRNPYLARIEAVHITPPQTVASLIRCIVKKEEREFGSVPLKSDPLNTELFEAPSSLAPMKQEQHLAIMNGSGPGSDPRKPLALVITEYALDKTICAIHDCRGEPHVHLTESLLISLKETVKLIPDG